MPGGTGMNTIIWVVGTIGFVTSFIGFSLHLVALSARDEHAREMLELLSIAFMSLAAASCLLMMATVMFSFLQFLFP